MRRFPLEAIAWTIGLVYLACIDPQASNHLTLCPFKILGFNHCPGCGLGLSISYLLHGDPVNAWNSHPLGFFAVPILVLRIVSLIKQFFAFPLTLKRKDVLDDERYADPSRA
jgi:hypothetical protein